MTISNKHNHKTFTESPPASLFNTLHRKHFESFVWEVPKFSEFNGCSEFHQVNGLCTKFIY